MNKMLFCFIIGLFISFICYLINFIFMLVSSIKFAKYLKKANYGRWRFLTSIGKLGPGLNNPIRTIKYIYGDQDNDDKMILKSKDVLRVRLMYFILFFSIIVINILIIVVLGLSYKAPPS